MPVAHIDSWFGVFGGQQQLVPVAFWQAKHIAKRGANVVNCK